MLRNLFSHFYKTTTVDEVGVEKWEQMKWEVDEVGIHHDRDTIGKHYRAYSQSGQVVFVERKKSINCMISIDRKSDTS